MTDKNVEENLRMLESIKDDVKQINNPKYILEVILMVKGMINFVANTKNDVDIQQELIWANEILLFAKEKLIKLIEGDE